MTPEEISQGVRIVAQLKEALESCRGTHSLDDVESMIKQGKLTLWVGDKSVAVTDIVQFPQMKVMSVFLGAGDLDEMSSCIEGMAAYARGCGCKGMQFYGKARARSAWRRMPGFNVTHVSMWRDL